MGGDGASDLTALQDALGHSFRRPALLRDALTHPSVSGARASAAFERLEFLGDRVLGLVTADHLMRTFPQEREGELARRHTAIVRQEGLIRIAEALGLENHLARAADLADTDGAVDSARGASPLADCMEAVLGALFLDGGLDAARRALETHVERLAAEDPEPPKDPKTALQEWSQARGLGLPAYQTLGREGPDHAPRFRVEVTLATHPPAVGAGRSKRQAEQEAASALLARLDGGADP